jgi:hypothetical protein
MQADGQSIGDVTALALRTRPAMSWTHLIRPVMATGAAPVGRADAADNGGTAR